MKFNRKKRKSHHESDTECDIESESILPSQFNEATDNFLIQTRRLLLIGEIDEITSTYICSHLQMLSCEKKPIYLYINSMGGCLASGYAIIDQMLACNCPVYTIIRGQAQSMAALIAALGAKGCRYSTSNSLIMLHSILVQNPSEPIEKHITMINYVQDDYLRKITSLARRLKITSKELIKVMSDTRWMSPKQAIDMGMIDGIWTPRMERAINKGLGK